MVKRNRSPTRKPQARKQLLLQDTSNTTLTMKEFRKLEPRLEELQTLARMEVARDVEHCAQSGFEPVVVPPIASDDFELGETISQSADGDVYDATYFGMPVIAKNVTLEKQRFDEIVGILRGLQSNPRIHLVTFVDAFVYKGHNWILMERCETDFLPDSDGSAWQLVYDLCETVLVMNACGISHGNISLDNMCLHKGHYCLFDFDTMSNIKEADNEGDTQAVLEIFAVLARLTKSARLKAFNEVISKTQETNLVDLYWVSGILKRCVDMHVSDEKLTKTALLISSLATTAYSLSAINIFLLLFYWILPESATSNDVFAALSAVLIAIDTRANVSASMGVWAMQYFSVKFGVRAVQFLSQTLFPIISPGSIIC